MLRQLFRNPTNSVVNQLRVASFVLLFFAIFNLFAIYRQINSMNGDGRIVNYAGIVRGKTQRLTKLVLSQSEIQETNKIIAELDQIIVGLTQGDRNLQLVRVEDSEFLSKMEQVEAAWGEFKIALERFSDSPNTQNQDRLLQASEAYWSLTNEAVFSAEKFAKHHVEASKGVAILLFVTNLIVLGMIWKITQSIRIRLQETIGNLSTSSTEISATVAEQEQVASHQATSVHETTTTMDELEASCRQSAEQAQAAVDVAQQALQLAAGGTNAVEATLAGILAMQKKMEAIAEQIVQLSEQATQIGGISQLVSELANQTNMLALNSSVEAVRAGEHGKGFAVVSNEIRKLSDQSQQSAEKIRILVAEIQKAINSAVMVTDEGAKTVKTSVQIAQQSEQAFAGVADAFNQVVLNNQQVSLNLKQQVHAIQQVVEAMNAVNRGSRETAIGLTQTKVGIEQLNQAALVLEEMV